MAESETNVPLILSETVSTFTQVQKKLSVSAVKKFKKLKAKRDRRKRKKLKFFKQNKFSLTKKSLISHQSTSSAVETENDTDQMDVNSTSKLVPPIAEVAAWQNQHQLSYWKSRATALEYENQMLHQHLRNIYAKQTQDYMEYLKENSGEFPNVEIITTASGNDVNKIPSLGSTNNSIEIIRSENHHDGQN